MKQVTDNELKDSGKAVLENESRSILNLLERVNDDFSNACRMILACAGRTVCIGMGKSGHIANKIAATLASTGTPAFFVHPGEASHGDLGMITANDVVIALSNSGETDEILTLLPVIKRLGIPLIAMTGNPASSLAVSASSILDVSVEEEACPLGLAPTSSTTASLAMGDALAVALLSARGFNKDDFALSHPGGSLGRRLLIHVEDIMHQGDEIPVVSVNTPFKELLIEMTEKGLGAVLVSDNDKPLLLGIFTDGDLRRALENGDNLYNTSAGDLMTQDCKRIHPELLAANALQIMDESRINALPVVNANDEIAGIINMHDLLKAKVI